MAVVILLTESDLDNILGAEVKPKGEEDKGWTPTTDGEEPPF